MRVAVVGVLLAALFSVSAAEAGEPDEVSRLQITATAGVRLSASTSVDDGAYLDVLGAYGYFPLPSFFVFDVSAGLTALEWLDVGSRAAYAIAPGGSADFSGDSLRLHSLQAGFFVRPMFTRERDGQGGVGLQLEAGVVAPFLTLRGETVTDTFAYFGPALVVHIPVGKLQPAIVIQYHFARWEDALAPGIDLSMGGLAVSGGINLSL